MLNYQYLQYQTRPVLDGLSRRSINAARDWPFNCFDEKADRGIQGRATQVIVFCLELVFSCSEGARLHCAVSQLGCFGT